MFSFFVGLNVGAFLGSGAMLEAKLDHVAKAWAQETMSRITKARGF